MPKSPVKSTISPECDQETGIGCYRDEVEWTIDTSDVVFIRLLLSRGWKADGDENEGYLRFKVPRKAITIRSRAAVGRKRVSSPATLDALRRGRAAKKGRK